MIEFSEGDISFDTVAFFKNETFGLRWLGVSTAVQKLLNRLGAILNVLLAVYLLECLVEFVVDALLVCYWHKLGILFTFRLDWILI